jgi:hypothetical protein
MERLARVKHSIALTPLISYKENKRLSRVKD